MDLQTATEQWPDNPYLIQLAMDLLLVFHHPDEEIQPARGSGASDIKLRLYSIDGGPFRSRGLRVSQARARGCRVPLPLEIEKIRKDVILLELPEGASDEESPVRLVVVPLLDRRAVTAGGAPSASGATRDQRGVRSAQSSLRAGNKAALMPPRHVIEYQRGGLREHEKQCLSDAAMYALVKHQYETNEISLKAARDIINSMCLRTSPIQSGHASIVTTYSEISHRRSTQGGNKDDAAPQPSDPDLQPYNRDIALHGWAIHAPSSQGNFLPGILIDAEASFARQRLEKAFLLDSTNGELSAGQKEYIETYLTHRHALEDEEDEPLLVPVLKQSTPAEAAGGNTESDTPVTGSEGGARVGDEGGAEVKE